MLVPKTILFKLTTVCDKNTMMFLTRQASVVSLMLETFALVSLLLPWNVNGGFIDMDTPLEKRTTKSLVDKTVYHLVCLKRIHMCSDS